MSLPSGNINKPSTNSLYQNLLQATVKKEQTPSMSEMLEVTPIQKDKGKEKEKERKEKIISPTQESMLKISNSQPISSFFFG